VTTVYSHQGAVDRIRLTTPPATTDACRSTRLRPEHLTGVRQLAVGLLGRASDDRVPSLLTRRTTNTDGVTTTGERHDQPTALGTPPVALLTACSEHRRCEQGKLAL